MYGSLALSHIWCEIHSWRLLLLLACTQSVLFAINIPFSCAYLWISSRFISIYLPFLFITADNRASLYPLWNKSICVIYSRLLRPYTHRSHSFFVDFFCSVCFFYDLHFLHLTECIQSTCNKRQLAFPFPLMITLFWFDKQEVRFHFSLWSLYFLRMISMWEYFIFNMDSRLQWKSAEKIKTGSLISYFYQNIRECCINFEKACRFSVKAVSTTLRPIMNPKRIETIFRLERSADRLFKKLSD